MSQETRHHQDQHGRDRLPVPALPLVFAHAVIAEHYQQAGGRTRRHPLEWPAGGGTRGG